jgi:hypothetical protein
MAIEVEPLRIMATSASATLISGGAAQDLFAVNASRKGWCIQNQSGGDLYVRSKGAAGTTPATTDQNSLKIPPGQYYEAPRVTSHALSIIGAVTGQAFFAEEW